MVSKARKNRNLKTAQDDFIFGRGLIPNMAVYGEYGRCAPFEADFCQGRQNPDLKNSRNIANIM